MNTTDLKNHNHHHYNINRINHMMMTKTEEDDVDFQDNKSETSSRSGGGKSKVFQCIGYGECNMVFTRSEHLARHMRKHTGEKPFKCVVPGCERMFSRFDNMMQHTQTHNKTRGGPRHHSTKTKRGSKKPTTGRRASSSDDYDEYRLPPSPPPSRRGSSNTVTKEHDIILPNSKYLEVDEDISDEDQLQQRSSYPDSPASSDSDYFASSQIRRRRSAPRIHYQPYPYYKDLQQRQPEIMPNILLPRRNSALSLLANYLVNNPDQSPESYLLQQRSCPKLTMTRRLSIQDLSNPIEALDSSSDDDDDDEQGVDLTEDEYQAIQGFGQFYKSACKK